MKPHRTALVLAALALAGCSAPAAATLPPAPQPTSGGPVVNRFDGTIRAATGNDITVSAPAARKVAETATNNGRPATAFTITVRNGGTEPLDLTLSTVTASHDGHEAAEVFDADDLSGVPNTKVRPGQTVTFTTAFDAPTPGRWDVDMTLTPDDRPAMFSTAVRP